MRLSRMPGMKWMGRFRGDESNTELADTTSSSLPSLTTNPSPTTSTPPTTSWAATQPNQNQPNGSYPATSQTNASYGVNNAGGYYTGPYNTSSATASYTGQAPNSPQVPQQGFYSHGPQPAVAQQGVYTADTRSAAPATASPYGAPADPYSANPNYGQSGYGATTAGSGNHYGQPPSTNTGGNVSGTSSGNYGQGQPESRYTVPTGTGQNAANPANFGYGGSYNGNTNNSPGTSQPGIPSVPATSAYGQVGSPGNQQVGETYPSNAAYGQSNAPYGQTTNVSAAPSNAANAGSPAVTGNTPWRPGSTSDYQPAVAPSGTSNGSVMPANYSPPQLPAGSAYGTAPAQAGNPQNSPSKTN